MAVRDARNLGAAAVLGKERPELVYRGTGADMASRRA
jgi:hypothetical protein